MRVNIAQATPPSLYRSHSCTAFSLLSRSNSKQTSENTTIRRSCSASFEGHAFSPKQRNKTHLKHPLKSSTTMSFTPSTSQLDVLEPSLLGIRPDPPDWPAREEIIRECIARRASSIELPLSLRMIKMKQKFMRLEEERESNTICDDPVSNLCCSTLYMIKEVQSHAIKIRGLVLDEELDNGVVAKVQREMTCSFVWLFREVFAKTPDLMLDVMVLTSNFASHSIGSTCLVEEQETKRLDLDVDGRTNEGSFVGGVKSLEVLDEREKGLWDEIVGEANEMTSVGFGGGLKDQGMRFVVDHEEEEKPLEFVSPLRVEIERDDDYEEYIRTDWTYQIGLSQEPNNTLLLSNYAQFLCLVTRDYDRAEECYKRVLQLDPTDAESLSQYANFLWLIRKDLWGAEERFQQAVATEPGNSYHASKYASFLWSTGGEDTCYPLDPPPGKS